MKMHTSKPPLSRIILAGATLFLILFIFNTVSGYAINTMPDRTKESSSRKLIVGTERGYYPFADVDDKGVPIGFSVDLFRAIAKEMGINFEFRIGTWSELLTAMENRQIDALPLVKYTEERDQFIDFTITHTTEHAVIIRRNDAKPVDSAADLSGKDVVVMKADGTDLYMTEHVPGARLIRVPTVEDTLRLLAEGKYDYGVVARSVGLVEIRDLGLNNLKPTGPPLEAFSKGFSLGVQEGDHETLALLNQGLNLVRQSGEYDTIYNHWFGDIDPRTSAEKLKHRLVYAGAVIFGILLIISSMIVLLRRLVTQKTKELASEIEVRKQAEKDIAKSEEKYREIVEGTDNLVVEIDCDGRFLFVNEASQKIFGLSARECIGRLAFDFVHPDDREQTLAHFNRWKKERKTSATYENRQINQSGEARDMLWTINFRYDTSGELTSIKGIARDITKRKQAKRKLLQSFVEIKELKNQLASESEYLREEIKSEHDFENIIGKSAAITYVFYKMEQVAAQDTTVLIQGETGSGKELVARAIHNLSPRVNRPLIKVNCAALPLHLMESELFGHEKGSFTGAHIKQIGRFELANGATLFLDEIGELPLELQAKLLRVLEEGEFEPIGSSRTVKVDVRIIAATNKNLETEVEEGRFRKDLLYRLKVYPITVPPLRERREDIPLLANLFLDTFNKKMAKKIDHISIATMQALQKYSWPGNVRELRNVIERAVINSSGSKLRLMEKLEITSKDSPDSLRPLQEVERNHIVNVLESTGWRVDGPKGAALILGLNPSTLRSRMRKLDIKKPQS